MSQDAGWSSLVARQAHNLKAAGSNPAPATKTMGSAYRVYVLKNPAGRFYIGVTADAERRLAQHNSGISRWTKGKGPWDRVWESESLSLAMHANWKIA